MTYLSNICWLRKGAKRISSIVSRKGVGMPLTAESGHPPNVHGWPSMQYRVIIDQSRCALTRNRPFNILEKWLLKSMSSDQVAAFKNLAFAPRSLPSESEFIELWCVLPWHPSFKLYNPTRHALKFVGNPEASQILRGAFGWDKPPRLRISWANGGFHVEQELTMHNNGRMYG